MYRNLSLTSALSRCNGGILNCQSRSTYKSKLFSQTQFYFSSATVVTKKTTNSAVKKNSEKNNSLSTTQLEEKMSPNYNTEDSQKQLNPKKTTDKKSSKISDIRNTFSPTPKGKSSLKNTYDSGKKNSTQKTIKVEKKSSNYTLINASQYDCEVNISPKFEELPSLKFGLDRTLFNPGVTVLQDPHSKVFNFDPYLQSIIDVEKFDFDKIVQYIPASKDETLQNLAFEHKKQFISTSSSTTHMLCHLYFIISNWRPVDTSVMNKGFQNMSKSFSRTLTCPGSIKLTRHENGVYSVDSDKSFEKQETVLSKLGQVMERMLTMPEAEFSTYLNHPEPKYSEPESCLYAYKLTRRMALRGQLDCADLRLPKKVFDLKTRAALPIRLDQDNYKDYIGYELKNSHETIESFSREYFDLMRSAFLKYSMQVRIGNMDGCLVAYHNTSRLFGFQYVSLAEMDERLFGSSVMGDQVFANTTQMFEEILNTVTTSYPDKDLLLSFKTVEGSSTMQIYVEFLTRDKGSPNTTSFNNIAKYELNCYSMVNGERKSKPFDLNDCDSWDLYYNLEKLNMDPLDLYNDYEKLRHLQATFYDFDREKLPVLQRMRALSHLRLSHPDPVTEPVVFTSLS